MPTSYKVLGKGEGKGKEEALTEGRGWLLQKTQNYFMNDHS